MRNTFISDPHALLNKLEDNELFIHELEDGYRSDVFDGTGRLDVFMDTHYLMQGGKVVWIGKLTNLEMWVNAHY